MAKLGASSLLVLLVALILIISQFTTASPLFGRNKNKKNGGAVQVSYTSNQPSNIDIIKTHRSNIYDVPTYQQSRNQGKRKING